MEKWEAARAPLRSGRAASGGGSEGLPDAELPILPVFGHTVWGAAQGLCV